jgi:acyl-CoA reductase-like NAD-dependent aldehyde dehydrogenase
MYMQTDTMKWLKRPLSDTTCDLGATTMPDQLKIIESLVNDAVEKGAKIAIGGKRNTKLGPGLFYEPTVLLNVTHKMKIAKEEVFGPVMVIMKFHTEVNIIFIFILFSCQKKYMRILQ